MRYVMRVWSRSYGDGYGDGSLWFERLDSGWRVVLVFASQVTAAWIDDGNTGDCDVNDGDVVRAMIERGRGFAFTGRGSVLVLLDFLLVLFEQFDLRDYDNHERRADFLEFLLHTGVSVGENDFAVMSSSLDYYNRLSMGEASPLNAPFRVSPVCYGDADASSPCMRFRRLRSLVSCDGEPCELDWDNTSSGVIGLSVVAVPHRGAFMLDIMFDLEFAVGVAPAKCHCAIGLAHEFLDADNVSRSFPERGNGVLSDVFLFSYGELLVFLRANSVNGFLDSNDVLGVADALVRLIPHGYRDNNGVPFTVRDAVDVFPELAESQKNRVLAECGPEHRERWYRAMGVRPALECYC